MIEILLKIDKENNVTYKAGDEDVMIKTQPEIADRAVREFVRKQLQRTIDDFMYRDMQYVRAGNIYIEISPHDKITAISRTKYYNIRKKANRYEIQ